MQKQPFFLLLIVLLSSFALTSCDQKKTANLQKTFQQGMVEVTIDGKRANVLSPFVTVIRVKAYGQKGESGEFELYTDDLSDENVAFSWTDDATCRITFTERDGAKKGFTLTASPGELALIQNKNQ